MINDREFLNQQLNLMMEIVEDIEEYGEDEPVYAIYEYNINLGATIIVDYWYVNEPQVRDDVEDSKLILEHYEELEELKKEKTKQMSLFKLLEEFRWQLEKYKIRKIEDKKAGQRQLAFFVPYLFRENGNAMKSKEIKTLILQRLETSRNTRKR